MAALCKAGDRVVSEPWCVGCRSNYRQMRCSQVSPLKGCYAMMPLNIKCGLSLAEAWLNHSFIKFQLFPRFRSIRVHRLKSRSISPQFRILLRGNLTVLSPAWYSSDGYSPRSIVSLFMSNVKSLAPIGKQHDKGVIPPGFIP